MSVGRATWPAVDSWYGAILGWKYKRGVGSTMGQALDMDKGWAVADTAKGGGRLVRMQAVVRWQEYAKWSAERIR